MRRGFTLIELLVAIAIIALLLVLLVGALGSTRAAGRTTVCLSNLRMLAVGWQTYADENKEVLVAHRAPDMGGGTANPANWHPVGNGMKFRPTWIARIGTNVGIDAFGEPRTDDGRQDYVSPVYVCPQVKTWTDERNAAYGYNYLFLGNSRFTNGQYHNWPVRLQKLTVTAGTVVAGDSLGTAASFAETQRGSYENDGRTERALANEGFSIDPPRLTPTSDMASSPLRNGMDARHGGSGESSTTVAMFADGHANRNTLRDLGYRLEADGRYMIMGPGPNNSMFSGTGADDDPPPLP